MAMGYKPDVALISPTYYLTYIQQNLLVHLDRITVATEVGIN